MTPSKARAALAALLVQALVFCAFPAAAWASDHDEAAARALFAEGRKLVDGGLYEEACLKFEESLRLDDGVGTSFNLADCQERIGRTASAWARFLAVAAASKADGQFKKERVARARATALEPKLSRLQIVVVAPRVEGLSVRRDGLSVGAAAWGLPVPVDPGEHRVEARAEKRRTWSQATTVPAQPVTIVISVPELEVLPEDPPAPLAPSAAAPRHSERRPQAEAPAGRLKWPVVGFAALAAAGVATAAVFALKLRAANDQAKSLCPDSACQTDAEKLRHDGLVDDAHRDRTLAWVSAGVGGAALVSAAYLWWRPLRSPPEQVSMSGWSLRPMAGGLGAELRLRY
jgi:hypothetical protein